MARAIQFKIPQRKLKIQKRREKETRLYSLLMLLLQEWNDGMRTQQLAISHTASAAAATCCSCRRRRNNNEFQVVYKTNVTRMHRVGRAATWRNASYSLQPAAESRPCLAPLRTRFLPPTSKRASLSLSIPNGGLPLFIIYSVANCQTGTFFLFLKQTIAAALLLPMKWKSPRVPCSLVYNRLLSLLPVIFLSFFCSQHSQLV